MEEKKVETCPWMTDRQAAAYLGLTTKFGYITVQKWARTGLLRGGKAGDQWRFKKEDLDDFVFSRK